MPEWSGAVWRAGNPPDRFWEMEAQERIAFGEGELAEVADRGEDVLVRGGG